MGGGGYLVGDVVFEVEYVCCVRYVFFVGDFVSNVVGEENVDGGVGEIVEVFVLNVIVICLGCVS